MMYEYCVYIVMGLVIGKKGKTIKEAESEEGVQNVRVDSDNGTISILARSPEAAARARKHLEFIEDRYPVVRDQIGRVVGKFFANIREIEENTGVVRITVDDPANPSSVRGGRGTKPFIHL